MHTILTHTVENDQKVVQQEEEQLDGTSVVVIGLQHFGGPPPTVSGTSLSPPMISFPSTGIQAEPMGKSDHYFRLFSTHAVARTDARTHTYTY